MATRTVRASFKIGGVLTTPTTAKLSDATGAYGVKRDDTDAVVVADATAMTPESTGIYTYSFTSIDGVAYTAWVEFVYGGNTYRQEINFAASSAVAVTLAGQTYTTLCVAMADYLGWTRNGEGDGLEWSSIEKHRLDDIIESGYLQLLYPPILPNETTAHRWSFLRPTETFHTVASDYLYDMPSTFGAPVGDMHYDEDEDVSRVIRQVSPGLIDRQRSVNDAEGRPSMFALRPKSVDQSLPQVTECMLYPTPDDAYGIVYHFDVRVEPLSDTNLYPLGGQAISEALLQSCRDIAAQRYRDEPGSREHDLFIQRLQASVEFDRRNSPEVLGYNRDGSQTCRISRHGSDFTCTLKHNLG
jgi:hypothetical protein